MTRPGHAPLKPPACCRLVAFSCRTVASRADTVRTLSWGERASQLPELTRVTEVTHDHRREFSEILDLLLNGVVHKHGRNGEEPHS